MQACVVAGKPLRPKDLNGIVTTAESFTVISASMSTIQMLTSCKFIDRAFQAILDHDCSYMREVTLALFNAALLAAFGITVSSFCFCACYRRVPLGIYLCGRCPWAMNHDVQYS
jgi:hypothetical protein